MNPVLEPFKVIMTGLFLWTIIGNLVLMVLEEFKTRRFKERTR